MPVQVQTPDGGIAEFPDYLSDAQIEATLKRSFPSPYAGHSMSLAQPVDINAPLPPPHGSTPLTPPPHQQRAAPTTALGAGLQGVDDTLGQTGRGALESVMSGAQRIAGNNPGFSVGKMLGTLLAGGKPQFENTGLADDTSLFNTVMRSGADHLGVQPWQIPQVAGPTSGQNSQAAVPWLQDQPRGILGRTMRTAGNVAPFGAAGVEGGAPSIFANIAGPTVGIAGAGEGARALGGSPDDIATAQMGGGVIGGMLANALANGPKHVENEAAKVTPPRSPQDIANILDTMRRGQAAYGDAGPTLPEATDYNTPGGQATMLQQRAEGTQAGIQGGLGARMAGRPAALQAALADVLQGIGPERDPTMTGLAAQRASEGAVADAEAARSAISGPDYRAAETQTVPRSEVGALLAEIDQAARGDTTGTVAPILMRLRQMMTNADGTPTTDVGNLNRARVNMRERIDLPPGSTDSVGRSTAGIVGPYLTRLADILDGSPEQARANELHGAVSDQFVNPTVAGPHGAISATTDAPTQAGVLFPSKPSTGMQPDITASTLMDLNRNGTAGSDLLRLHLGQQGPESVQNLQGGPNTFAPSNFSSRMAGNPTQRAALLAGTDAVAPNVTQNLADLLDAGDAMATRRAPGSTTFNKAETAASVDGTGRAMLAGDARGIVSRTLGGLSRAFDQAKVNANQADLTAYANANPEEAAGWLARIEAARGNTPLQRTLLGSLKGLAASQPATQRQAQ